MFGSMLKKPRRSMRLFIEHDSLLGGAVYKLEL